MSTPQLPNGSKLFIGTTIGTAKAISSLSNASPAIAALAAGHLIASGDIMIVESGWSDLNNRVVKAGTVAGDNVPLAGIDATSLVRYPAGSGVGNVREVSGWVEILDYANFTTNVGQQQFAQRQATGASSPVKIPSYRDPSDINFDILNDTSAAHYAALLAADQTRQPVPLYLLLPNGGTRYYYAYVALDDVEKLSVNEVMVYGCSLTLVSRAVAYS
jgi:hypothetical protein